MRSWSFFFILSLICELSIGQTRFYRFSINLVDKNGQHLKAVEVTSQRTNPNTFNGDPIKLYHIHRKDGGKDYFVEGEELDLHFSHLLSDRKQDMTIEVPSEGRELPITLDSITSLASQRNVEEIINNEGVDPKVLARIKHNLDKLHAAIAFIGGNTGSDIEKHDRAVSVYNLFVDSCYTMIEVSMVKNGKVIKWERTIEEYFIHLSRLNRKVTIIWEVAHVQRTREYDGVLGENYDYKAIIDQTYTGYSSSSSDTTAIYYRDKTKKMIPVRIEYDRIVEANTASYYERYLFGNIIILDTQEE